MLRRIRLIIKLQKKTYAVVKRIREWRQNKLKIFEPIVKPKNKRLEGGRGKPLERKIRKLIN